MREVSRQDLQDAKEEFGILKFGILGTLHLGLGESLPDSSPHLAAFFGLAHHR
jgi:hypothetical protein